MQNKQYVPLRQCAGCGERYPKHELVRIGVVEGILTADVKAGSAGRGVYVCRSRSCIEKAFRKRSFTRVFPGASGLEELKIQLERMADHAE